VVTDPEEKEGSEYGFAQGIVRSKVEIIKNLLAADLFTIAQIASFVNETESFVEKVRAILNMEEIIDGIRQFNLNVDKAKKEGVEQGKVEAIKSLLAANRFTIAQIANFANVTESLVKKVRAGLNKKQK
jgi:phage portal protein BeeE